MPMLTTDHLDGMQRVVGAWGDHTFPQSTLDAITAHLREEVHELATACEDAPFPRAAPDIGIAEEAADCLLLLLHLAHREGFSLWEAANAKRIVNETRTWETDAGEKGYQKHTEDEPCPPCTTT